MSLKEALALRLKEFTYIFFIYLESLAERKAGRTGGEGG